MRFLSLFRIYESRGLSVVDKNGAVKPLTELHQEALEKELRDTAEANLKNLKR